MRCLPAWTLLALLMLMLGGCTWWHSAPPVESRSTKPAPSRQATEFTPEPLSRYGNPEYYDVLGKRYFPLKSATGFTEQGIASWYGPDFHGGLTSTREPYDMHSMTAAHKTLPLPTWVEVKNLTNGRTARVRVNDRGPFKDNRIIDLSYAAATELDIVKPGTALVKIRAINSPDVPAHFPQSAPAAPQMFMQIGAFGDRSNAERMRDRLAEKFGAQVRILEDSATGAPLFKVALGPIKDVAHADRTAAELATLGINQHQFVNHQ